MTIFFEVRLQYGIVSLCNQLLAEFSSNQLQTLLRFYKYIEDMHVTFAGKKRSFDKITAFFTWTLLRLGFSKG